MQSTGLTSSNVASQLIYKACYARRNSGRRIVLLTLLGISFLFFLGYVFRNPIGVQDNSLFLDSPTSDYLMDESNVRVLTRMEGGDTKRLRRLNVAERLRMLEMKFGGFANWARDPFIGFKVVSQCKKTSLLDEFGCPGGVGKCPGLYDHAVCLDNKDELFGKDCLVYDFGIRQQPEFGQIMATHFGCEVHAFDPSSISTTWYEGSEVAKLPNYHFHPYGAGGTDGDIRLSQYNWGQVSILRDPNGSSKEHLLPVKRLSTIMNDLGHSKRRISVIKLDVEGSEFSFLEDIFDTLGCIPAEQLSVEWHHFDFDNRYGGGSNGAINALVTQLAACGLKQFWRHHDAGWFGGDRKEFEKVGLHHVRYNLASFHRERS